MESTERVEKTTGPPIVALDGNRARQIREAKKLTQLYVANVVGVTTDTISRWENNRYPTVKRDNAEKLAAALEVELDDILLQQQEEPLPPEEAAEEKPKRSRLLLLLSTTLLIITAAAVYFFVAPPHIPVDATRILPPYCAPGTVLPVQIRIERKDGATQGMVVKESVPPGWKVLRASPAPAADPALDDEVKWLIPSGSGPVVIKYTVTVPVAVKGAAEAGFSGRVVAGTEKGTATAPVGGDNDVRVADKHWADGNGDGVIDDNEIMPAYYVTEEMKGLGLDWETIESIWNSKGYVWDPVSRRFFPLKRPPSR